MSLSGRWQRPSFRLWRRSCSPWTSHVSISHATTEDDWGRLLDYIASYSPKVTPIHIKELASRRPADPEHTINHVLKAVKEGSYFPQPTAIQDFLQTCHVWNMPDKAVEFLAIVRVLMSYQADNGIYSLLLNRHPPGRNLSSAAVRQVLQMAEEDQVEVDAFLLTKAVHVCCSASDIAALDLLEELQQLGPVSVETYRLVLEVVVVHAEKLHSKLRASLRSDSLELSKSIKDVLGRATNLVASMQRDGHEIPARSVTRLRRLLAAANHTRLPEFASLVYEQKPSVNKTSIAKLIHESHSPAEILPTIPIAERTEDFYVNLLSRLGHLRQSGVVDVWLDLRYNDIRLTRKLYTALFFALRQSPSAEERGRIPAFYDDMMVDLKRDHVDRVLITGVIRAALQIIDDAVREKMVHRVLQDAALSGMPLYPVTRKLLQDSGFASALLLYHPKPHVGTPHVNVPKWWLAVRPSLLS